jgi:hypothetical protein
MKKSVCDVSRILAGIGIIASLLLSGASQGWAQQTAAISKNQLIGAWTLVSWESVTKDGTKEPTMEGTNLKGLLIFDASRFSLQVISEYPKLASRDRMKTTPEENKAVAHGVLSLFGTYSVSEAERVLTFRVERSSFPNQNGEDLKRVITSLTADELIYTTPARLAGGSNTFVWKRAK